MGLKIANTAQTADHSLTTSYSVLAVIDIPDSCYLESLHVDLNTLASSAAIVSTKISIDVAGDILYTDVNAETLIVGETTTTDSGYTISIGRYYTTFAAGTRNKLWIWGKTDAGTIKAKYQFTYTEQV